MLPKSHQWLSLNREDARRFAKYVIRGLNYWVYNALLTPYTQVFGTGATDEAVISAALVASMVDEDAGVRDKRGPFSDPAKTPLQYLLDHLGGTSSCITFAMWRDCFPESTGISIATNYCVVHDLRTL